ncbi:lipopolysaccharide biosynthesis protein [Dermabacteraceae bacterium P13077]
MNPKRLLGAAGTIGASLIFASVLGFALLAIIARWLGPDLNGRFLTLWGAVMAFGSILSVIEQEAVRQVTHAHLKGQKAPGSLVQLAVTAFGFSLLGLAVLLCFPNGREIFASSLLVIGVSFLAVSGFTAQYTVRAIALGKDSPRRYALVILVEALSRLVLAAVLAAGGAVPTLLLSALVIAVGSFGWLPVARFAAANLDWRTGRISWAKTARLVLILGAANGLSAAVLTGYPALVTLVTGASEGLGSFFGAVTLTRIPLVLLAPVQAMAVPVATRFVSAGDIAGISRVQRGILGGLFLTMLAGALATYLTGEFFYHLFLGSEYSVSALELVALIIATVVIAGCLLQAAVLVALEEYLSVVTAWGIAVAAAVACLALVPGDAQTRALYGFVACSFAACGAATLLLNRATRKHGRAATSIR